MDTDNCQKRLLPKLAWSREIAEADLSDDSIATPGKL
jgi:P2-related tail formation protein